MGAVFGKGLWPIGWSIGLIRLPLAPVLDWVGESETEADQIELGAASIDAQVAELLPMEMPYRKRLFVEVSEAWTAAFDNSRGGGDPFPVVSGIARDRLVVSILATHRDRTQSSSPATQFHLFGPSGEAPLMYVRTVDAGVFDSGRWSFRTSGQVQPFEQPARYEERSVADRFTRSMLIDYLAAVGVRPDDADEYGAGVLHVERTSWEPGWTATLEEARGEHLSST